jgi:hypothetical protein
MRLKYEWRAIHADGSVTDEIDYVTQKPIPITTIFMKPLKMVQLIDTETDEVKITIHINKGQKPIIRRRWTHHFRLDTGEQTRIPVWFIGKHWKIKTVDGPRNVQILLLVHENGYVEALDRWRDEHPLYHPVNLMKEEQLEVEE